MSNPFKIKVVLQHPGQINKGLTTIVDIVYYTLCEHLYPAMAFSNTHKSAMGIVLS